MENEKTKLETHVVCSNRLEKEGGKARCCQCEPHEGCSIYVVTNDKEEFEKFITNHKINGNTFSGNIGTVDTEGLWNWIESKLKAKDEEIERLKEELDKFNEVLGGSYTL